MIHLRTIIISVIIMSVIGGCVQMVVHKIAMKHALSKIGKESFLHDLNEINLDREKAGLQPLNECVEMYHYNPDWANWAKGKAHCKHIIDSLIENGIESDRTKSRVFSTDIWFVIRNKMFLVHLRKVNLVREKAGLQPLNECVERYHYFDFDPDRDFYKDDCKQVKDSLVENEINADYTKSQVYTIDWFTPRKQIFFQDFTHISYNREKAGLQPLNECVEMYHFDPDWAKGEAYCKHIIDSLIENGIESDPTKSQVTLESDSTDTVENKSDES